MPAHARYALEDLQLGWEFVALVFFYIIGVPLLLGSATHLVLKRCFRAYSSNVVLPLFFSCIAWWGSFFLFLQLDKTPAQPAAVQESAQPYVSAYAQRQALLASAHDSLLKTQLVSMTDKEISARVEAERRVKEEKQRISQAETTKRESDIGLCFMALSSIGAAALGYFTERKLKST